LEAGFFAWVLTEDNDLQKVDIIVAFEGGYDRSTSSSDCNLSHTARGGSVLPVETYNIMSPITVFSN